MVIDSIRGNGNKLSILQEACRLDDEVRMIMVSGYKAELTQRANERFVLKPFMLRELFQPARADTSRVGQG